MAASPQCTGSQRPEKNIAELEQPPYSPDPALRFPFYLFFFFFFSFLQAQGDHQGDPFRRRGGHKEARNDGAEGHPSRILLECIEAWQRKMGKCLRLEGV